MPAAFCRILWSALLPSHALFMILFPLRRKVSGCAILNGPVILQPGKMSDKIRGTNSKINKVRLGSRLIQISF